MRCINPKYSTFLSPLEKAIGLSFLPKLTSQPSFHDAERKIFALPTRLGGFGVVDPISYPQSAAIYHCLNFATISYLPC